MILVDAALRRRAAEGNPIRVGLVGTGAMGKAILLQIETVVPGMAVVAAANRTVANAVESYRAAGDPEVQVVVDEQGLATAIEEDRRAVTSDPFLLTGSPHIDVVFEVTGTVEYAARVVLDAIQHGKHTVTMNAELQGTLGPILKRRADEVGVILTDSDGDQPGVMMNLFRFVSSLGLRPVLIGNIKGLHDPYRNPKTQAEFARKHHLTPHMAASFADGTKMSFEQTLVANATGLRAGKRGLYGFHAQSVQEARDLYPLQQMLDTGLVDYLVGAEPKPGVFVLGYETHAEQQRWLGLYKLGAGPLYTFYTPYHLCHLEAPFTVARAVLFGDAAVAPEAGHVLDVVATAKRDLEAGETLDGIGWFMTYGQCENADVVKAERLLPMGLAEGCRLLRAIPRDEVLTYDDVELPPDRLVDRLRTEQETVAHTGT